MAPNAANCIRVPGLVLCENWTTRLREADTWQVQAQFAIACPLEKPNGGRYPKMRRRRVVDGPVSFDENVKHWLRGSRMRGAILARVGAAVVVTAGASTTAAASTPAAAGGSVVALVASSSAATSLRAPSS